MDDPGGGVRHRRRRLQHAERRHQHLQRLLLRHPEDLGRAEKAGGASTKPSWPASTGSSARLPQGIAFAFSPPAIPGIGTCRRRHLHAGGSGRQGHRVPLGEHPEVPGRGAQAAGARPGHHHLPAHACRRSSSRWTATRCSSRGWTSPRSTRRCRPSWAATSSTTSTASAASGRFTCRPRASTGPRPSSSGQFYVRNKNGDTVPLSRRSPASSSAPGPEFTMRYNLYRSAQINAVAGPGLQFRPGDEGPGGGLRGDHAARDGL